MARLLFGVTGGIAAYKALEAVRLATKQGHAVRVIQTPTSERFVGKASFEAITGAPVLTSEFEPDPARGSYPGEPLPERAPISHLALVERAELYVIAPATANTIAKLAHGQADNLLTSAALAATCPGRRRAGDEQLDVPASGDPAERPHPRAIAGSRSSNPARGTSPRTASTASVASPSPRSSSTRSSSS